MGFEVESLDHMPACYQLSHPCLFKDTLNYKKHYSQKAYLYINYRDQREEFYLQRHSHLKDRKHSQK